MTNIVSQRTPRSRKGGPDDPSHAPAPGFEVAPGGVAQVVVFGMLKGGVGKTRLAMLTAFFLAMLNHRVLVINADSSSQTADGWKQRVEAATDDEGNPLGQEMPFEVLTYARDDLAKVIDQRRASGQYDIIICDVGGANTMALVNAAKEANKLIMPCGPEQGEVDRLEPTREMALAGAMRSRVGGCDLYVVFNKVDGRRNGQSAEFRSALEDPDVNGEDGPYPLAYTEIPIRAAYADSYGTLCDTFRFDERNYHQLDYLMHELGIYEFARLVKEFAGSPEDEAVTV